MNKAKSVLVAAGVSLAMIFTLSCSSDDGNGTSSDDTHGDSGNFTDSRDSKTYKWVRIGEQIWMAENLNYDADNSKCYIGYGTSEDYCPKYGRLYNWATVMNEAAGSTTNPSGVRGICPEGWHVPSDVEWDELIATVGDAAGNKLKTTNGWGYDEQPNFDGTDEYGFSALPGGDGSHSGFYEAGVRGNWWSATESSASDAYSRNMRSANSTVGRSFASKTSLYSLRCLRDN